MTMTDEEAIRFTVRALVAEWQQSRLVRMIDTSYPVALEARLQQLCEIVGVDGPQQLPAPPSAIADGKRRDDPGDTHGPYRGGKNVVR